MEMEMGDDDFARLIVCIYVCMYVSSTPSKNYTILSYRLAPDK